MLNYRIPEMTQCADKYEVRKHVADRGCASLLNDLYGVWDDPADMVFEQLPDAFVLKVTHGSGQNLICRDKSRLNVKSTRRQLAEWMRRSEYWVSREWAYKNIRPRIICERLLTDEQGAVPADFKFFCFDRRATIYTSGYGSLYDPSPGYIRPRLDACFPSVSSFRPVAERFHGR